MALTMANLKAILSPDFVPSDLSAPENSIWLVYAAVIIEPVAKSTHITELWKRLYLLPLRLYVHRTLFHTQE